MECKRCSLKLNVPQTLLSKSLEELDSKLLSSPGNFDALSVPVECQTLEEVAQMTLVSVALSTPVRHIRVRRQILASDAVSPRMRVNKATLEDDGLEVAIVVGDDTWSLLVDLIEFEILGEMLDLGAFQSQWSVEVCKHLLPINGHEDVLILKVPKKVDSLCLKVGDHHSRVINWVIEHSISRTINTDAPRSRMVREDPFNRILTSILDELRLVLDQIVHEFARTV